MYTNSIPERESYSQILFSFWVDFQKRATIPVIGIEHIVKGTSEERDGKASRHLVEMRHDKIVDDTSHVKRVVSVIDDAIPHIIKRVLGETSSPHGTLPRIGVIGHVRLDEALIKVPVLVRKRAIAVTSEIRTSHIVHLDRDAVPKNVDKPRNHPLATSVGRREVREAHLAVHIKSKTLPTLEDNNVIAIEQTLDAPIVDDGHIINHGFEIVNPVSLQPLNVKSGDGVKPDTPLVLIVPLNVGNIIIERIIDKIAEVSDLTGQNPATAIIVASDGLKDAHATRPVSHVSSLFRKLISNHVKRSDDTTPSIHIALIGTVALLDVGHWIDKKILMKVGIGAELAASRKMMVHMTKTIEFNGMTSLGATIVENGQTPLAILLSLGRKVGRYQSLALVTVVGSNNELHIRH